MRATPPNGNGERRNSTESTEESTETTENINGEAFGNAPQLQRSVLSVGVLGALVLSRRWRCSVGVRGSLTAHGPNRSGAYAVTSTELDPPVTSSAITLAVSGARSTPFLEWPHA